MASYSSPSSSPPPSPSRRRLKSCARRCERGCCALATYFPLAFVYGLTTWAAWVEANIGLGFTGAKHSTGSVKASSMFAVCLYLLLNTCYTVAVFTDPGSPQDAPNSRSKSSQQNGKYSILPTTDPSLDHERNGSAASHAPPHTKPSSVQPITVSSRGSSRFCKKCHTSKPDRTHHCSTCKRCVLKMDHHCPWLATCLGLHNYKPFLLFLIYTSVFSWVCLVSSGYWLWNHMFASNQYLEEFAPINIVMLCVVSGIIGLVLTGFTAWHIWLVMRGQTTIECLEKTRYLSGVRSRVERNRVDNMHASHHRTNSNDLSGRVKRAGEQLLEFHANAVPGASRYEEGEEHTSPTPSMRYPPHARFDMGAPQQYHDHPAAHDRSDTATPAVRALRRTYQQQSQSSYEHDREADRYAEYLDDRESEKMPNAFDLGWRRNLLHMFGPNPWLWFLPICNTTGDGWRWDVSEKWVRAREEMEVRQQERLGQYGGEQGGYGDLRGGVGFDGVGEYGDDREVGYERDRAGGEEYARSAVNMQTLNSKGGMKDRVWGGRYRKDVDRSGENGEAESFEVSSGEEGPDPLEERGPGRGREGVQRGWSRDWD